MSRGWARHTPCGSPQVVQLVPADHQISRVTGEPAHTQTCRGNLRVDQDSGRMPQATVQRGGAQSALDGTHGHSLRPAPHGENSCARAGSHRSYRTHFPLISSLLYSSSALILPVLSPGADVLIIWVDGV